MEEWDHTSIKTRTEYRRIGSVNIRLGKHAEHGLIMVKHGLTTYRWDPDEEGTIWTCETFVHPDHRQKGIGLRLVRKLHSLPGVKKIRSLTNARRPDVTGMYLKAGHTILHQDEDYIWWLWKPEASERR